MVLPRSTVSAVAVGAAGKTAMTVQMAAVVTIAAGCLTGSLRQVAIWIGGLVFHVSKAGGCVDGPREVP